MGVGGLLLLDSLETLDTEFFFDIPRVLSSSEGASWIVAGSFEILGTGPMSSRECMDTEAK